MIGAYHPLAPCSCTLNASGERVFIDPSFHWPARRAVSVPHVAGHVTRRRPAPEVVELALVMRPAVGLA